MFSKLIYIGSCTRLAGMELVFFTVSCGVQDLSCFGLVTKTGLITHQSFICCWTVLVQHQGLLRFSFCPTSKQAGGAQVAGRGHSKTADPTGTPYHLVSRSAKKTNIVFPNETLLRDWLGINWQWAIAFASFFFFPQVLPSPHLSLSWPTSFL